MTERPTKIVVRRRPYLSWVFGAILIVLVALVIRNFITNDRWDWPTVGKYLFDSKVLGGLVATIYLTVISSITGLVLGLIVAIMRLSKNPIARGVAAFYVGLMRAIPALVLLIFIFYLAALFPTIPIGIPFGPTFVELDSNQVISQFSAAVIGLTLILGGHLGEIIRGGILSVNKGQVEAAKALGFPPYLVMRRIVLPQAVRVAIPAVANELISLFKNTSLVSVIGFSELFTVVQTIYGVTYQTIPLLLVACIWYGVLTALAMFGQRRLEKIFGRGH